jgi:hypothetical protein
MADVTGQIGDQEVQLDNAATEATLKQLLAAMLAMAAAGKAGGLSAKAAKELEATLKKLTKKSQELESQEDKELKDSKKRAAEKKKAEEEQIKKAQEVGAALNTLFSTVEKVATGMTDLMQTLANVGNSVSSAAESLNKIPVVGGVLSGVLGAVAGAAEKTYKSFQSVSSVGANFGGSISEMIDAASSAGLTFDDFNGVIQQNADALRYLGGSTSEGAARLARLSKELRNNTTQYGQVNDDLARLGYSTADITGGMAKYAAMQQKAGRQQAMTDAELIAGTQRYLKDLDAVAKLTGQSKEALQSEMEARQRDAGFRLLQSKLDQTGRDNMELFLNSMEKANQEAFKDMVRTGNFHGEAARKLLETSPDMARVLMDQAQQVRASGTLTRKEAERTDAAMREAAKATIEQSRFQQQAGYMTAEYNDQLLATQNTAARASTLAETSAKQDEELAKARQKKEKDLQDSLDPASMKKYQEQISNVSNQFTKLLGSSTLLDDMMYLFKGLSNVIQNTVVPVFKFVSEYSTAFGIALGALGVVVGLTSALMTAANVVRALETLSMTGLLAPLAAMAATVWAAVAPFLPLVAGVAAAGAAIYLLWQGFKSLGGSTDMIVDAFKVLWSYLKEFGQNIVLLYYNMMDKITVGDKYKKLAEQQEQNIQATKDEREALKEKMAADRIANKAKYDAEKKAEEAKKNNTEETNKNTEAAKKAREEEEEKKQQEGKTPSAPNWMDPNSTFKYFNERMKQPGTTATGPSTAGPRTGPAPSAPAHQGLGGMAAAFESGKAGSQAVGWDSTGGTSYGKYQIAAKTGTMDKFMEHLKKTNEEAYERLSKAGPADAGKGGAFAEEWKKLGKEGKLQQSEHDFIKKTHYDKGAAGLKDENLKGMIEKSKALQEVMWSTSVQHGGGGASGIFNKVFKEGMSEEDLIKSIYAERGTRFKSSTPQVRASVQNRFAQEQQLALGMVGQPGTAATENLAMYDQSKQKPSATQSQTEQYTINGKPATREEYDAFMKSNPELAQMQNRLGIPKTPGSTLPNAEQQLAKDESALAKTQVSEMAKEKMPTEKPAQESAESLLANLNTKMDTLIMISSRTANSSEKQVKSMAGLSGDMFVAA